MDDLQRTIISLKQRVSQEEPYSVGNEGKGDFVFLIKEPGVDAFVYDTGVYIVRMGFGDQKGLRRQANFIKAMKILIAEGYRPAPYFKPGFRERYEDQHKRAKEKGTEAVRFFPSYEKINMKKSRLDYDQVSLAQPSIISQQKVYRQPNMIRQQPLMMDNENQYTNLFKKIDIAALEIGQPQIRAQTRIKTPNTFEILTAPKYYNWTRNIYAGVIGREAALGLRRPIKKPSKDKDKDKKNKEKKEKGEEHEYE